MVIIRSPSNVKAVGHLPSYYTDVQPVTSPNKKPPVPSGTQNLLQRTLAEAEMDQEKMWLQVVRDVCDNDDVQRLEIFPGLHIMQISNYCRMSQLHPQLCFLSFMIKLIR